MNYNFIIETNAIVLNWSWWKAPLINLDENFSIAHIQKMCKIVINFDCDLITFVVYNLLNERK